MGTKGKTYEEIYGVEKAAELRVLRRKNAISQMTLQRRGKTHTEIYGEKKAKDISKKMSKSNSGKGNSNYQGGKILINCLKCHKSIEVFKGKRYTTKYCSYKCHNEARSKQVKFKCVICKKQHQRKLSKVGIKVCSRACYERWKWGENNPNWKNGKSYQPYARTWTKELRLAIRTRDNFICQLCDMTEKESLDSMQRVLAVHHIDYNKQHCYELNLITLCVPCNAGVNSKRDYWTKYFNSKIGELV